MFQTFISREVLYARHMLLLISIGSHKWRSRQSLDPTLGDMERSKSIKFMVSCVMFSVVATTAVIKQSVEVHRALVFKFTDGLYKDIFINPL